MSIQRKYFGTDGIRGCVGQDPIKPDFILKLGWAFGNVLAKNDNKRCRVLIGKDTRISGYMFESALEAGLSAAGIDIQLLGPMPTPSVAYLTRALRAQAGIVISASHNSYKDNGIKFFSSDGDKLQDEVELQIERNLELPITTVSSELLGKATRLNDAPRRYIEFCKNIIPQEKSFQGLKIIVDCANGATYKIAPTVFSELGAEVLEIAADPDGLNINDLCGATHPETLRKIVLAEDADLGIAFDGDGDRVIMVDHLGEVVDGDEILFIIAKYLKNKKRFSGGVVGTLMSNFGLEAAFRGMEIPFIRSKVGDRYVLEELKNNHWILGGESSGHIVYLNATTTGDGIISALLVLDSVVSSNKTLHELKKGFEKFPQKLVNVKTHKRIDLDNQPEIQKALQEAKQKLKNQGRILLRNSGTEPLVRIMAEGQNENLVYQIVKDLEEVVQKVSLKG